MLVSPLGAVGAGVVAALLGQLDPPAGPRRGVAAGVDLERTITPTREGTDDPTPVRRRTPTAVARDRTSAERPEAATLLNALDGVESGSVTTVGPLSSGFANRTIAGGSAAAASTGGLPDQPRLRADVPAVGSTDAGSGAASSVAAVLPPEPPTGDRGGEQPSRVLGDGLSNVVTLHAATADAPAVTLEAPGHRIAAAQALVAPAGAGQVAFPYGLFAFEVHDVTPGGLATVRMTLPTGATPPAYYKIDTHGAEPQRFTFDGQTGAEVAGNLVTLHLRDGGRGDADGLANGVIVDPGGPGGAVQIVDDGGPGWSDTPTGSWTSSTGAAGYYGAGYHHDTNGGDWAAYTFAVTPGATYRIAATWAPHSNRAPNAPFTVDNGGALPAVTVDQRLAPDDFQAGTSWWEELYGSVVAAGSTLTVRLDSVVSGAVIADAVRVEEIAPPPPAAVQIVDDGDAGYAETGTWAASSHPGYDGDTRFSHPGQGDTASWSFTVTPGATYRVSVSYAARSSRATDAPYTVLDGATPLATVAINQEQAADDLTDAGVGWEDLGSFVVADAALTVRLSDLADDKVGADAVRVERLDHDHDHDCRPALDVMMVLDGSGSIAPEEFTLQRAFARDLTAAFVIGPQAAPLRRRPVRLGEQRAGGPARVRPLGRPGRGHLGDRRDRPAHRRDLHPG